LLVRSDRRSFGYGLLLYAVSVSIATVYGRYHYTADVLAGFAVSLIPGLLCLILSKRELELQSVRNSNL
jgi:membrane-associated phospholipid phosphatase